MDRRPSTDDFEAPGYGWKRAAARSKPERRGWSLSVMKAAGWGQLSFSVKRSSVGVVVVWHDMPNSTGRHIGTI